MVAELLVLCALAAAAAAAWGHSMPSGEEIPTWDGDPASFESFATSCKWYESGLKDNEKKLAAPRIWQRLSGVARSVVKHLEPKDFSTDGGLERLMAVLRSRPSRSCPSRTASPAWRGGPTSGGLGMKAFHNSWCASSSSWSYNRPCKGPGTRRPS